MDHPRRASLDDDMQAYFHPHGHGQWSDPMHVDAQTEDIPWDDGASNCFEPIANSAQLIPRAELDSLLSPQPPNLGLACPGPQGKQRVRQRISSPAKAILQQWFDDHIEDPYLEREDVSALSEATGLTPRQRGQGVCRSEQQADATIRQQYAVSQAASRRTSENSVLKPAKPDATNPDAFSEAASSNSSSSSRASIDSAVNRVPRRGRKRHRGSLRRSNTVVRGRIDRSKIFQCTFCNRDFAQKYDWRRHEESVHIPQKEWICMPDGPVRTDDDTGSQSCVFCEQPNPSHDHLQRHNHTPCLLAPQTSRTFTRKDKLIQHLGQVHKQAQMSATMQTWCRRVSRNIAIACGICGVRLCTWNERVEHISAHFIDGLDMRYWLGAPGGVMSLTAPATTEHHTHYRYGPSSSSSSSASAPQPPPAIVDPLFPAYSPPPRSAHDHSASHSCTSCTLSFTRYSDTVFHERQAHRMYKPRPQPTEDGGNIANPLQQQSRADNFDLGGPESAVGQRRGGGRGPVASLMQQQQQQQHASADLPVAAVLWGGSSGGSEGRSKALLDEDRERGEGGKGAKRLFWRDDA
ncbi:homeodomain mating type protein alpha2 [Diplodia intermedia]|uniref:Homeodomain mating type protein alpha2 n=1 Tax=Diplodia intermedia TaxID=856260 RepID=A0ABR3THR0_9PEZI